MTTMSRLGFLRCAGALVAGVAAGPAFFLKASPAAAAEVPMVTVMCECARGPRTAANHTHTICSRCLPVHDHGRRYSGYLDEITFHAQASFAA